MKQQSPLETQSFGVLLRFLRLRAGLTQRELAARVSYSEAHINRFERGVRMPDAGLVAARFVAALGLAQHSDEAAQLIQLAAKPNGTNLHAPAQTNGHSSALPAAGSHLFGRDGDLNNAQALLQQPETRVLTLIGPPGVGKTRLSIALAARLAPHFADSAVFVPLAAIDDSQRIPDAFLQAMDIQSSSQEPLAQLTRVLKTRSCVFVLDNFEQLLVDSPAGGAAALVSGLIAGAPQARFIVTSRAPLRISGEHIYEVPSLQPKDACALFLNRARASNPHFQIRADEVVTIQEICARLDHLPLAIELAAARTRVFDAPALLKRLAAPLALLTSGAQDLPRRQRTLRNAIDWSYHLLTAEEQTLFRRLSIFADGCALPMLEAIAADGLTTPIADLMQSLVEKSLVRSVNTMQGMRFYLLEMLRGYAGESLAASGEAEELYRRQAEWFVDYVEDVQSVPEKSDNRPWYDWLGAEWLNLRAVIQRSIDSDDPVPGLRLAACLGWSWKIHGPLKDGCELTRSLLSHPQASQHRHLCARAKLAGSQPAKGIGEVALSMQYLQDALDVFRAAGDKWNLAWTLSSLADHACNRAEYDLAEKLLVESTALSREVGDKKGLTWSLMWVGWVERIRGNYDKALDTYAEMSCVVREIRSGTMAFASFAWTAWVYQDMGDYERAWRLVESAHETCLKVGLRNSALNMQAALGSNALYRSDLGSALNHLQEAAQGLQQNGSEELRYTPLARLGLVNHLLGDTAKGKSQLHETLLAAQTNNQIVIVIDSLRYLAWVAADEGDFPRSVRLMSMVAACDAQTGVTTPAYTSHFQAPRIACAKANLTPQKFDQCWEEGRQLKRAEAVDHALQGSAMRVQTSR
jgi:predicted ATPase/DNA-binding XRE family transcriptional regulator